MRRPQRQRRSKRSRDSRAQFVSMPRVEDGNGTIVELQVTTSHSKMLQSLIVWGQAGCPWSISTHLFGSPRTQSRRSFHGKRRESVAQDSNKFDECNISIDNGSPLRLGLTITPSLARGFEASDEVGLSTCLGRVQCRFHVSAVSLEILKRSPSDHAFKDSQTS